MQPNPPPSMESAAPTSGMYSTQPTPHFYPNPQYPVYYPQLQNPNSNIDPQQPYDPNGLNSLIQPPGLDPNPAISANTYANAHESHHLALHYAYPSAAAATYYQDPNAVISHYPYANGVTIPPTMTAKRNSSLQVKRPAGLRKTNFLKKGLKKVKVVQSAWCEVCKVDCNSKNVLDQHKLGKKHKKNLEKLIAANAVNTTPAPPVSAPTEVTTPGSASAPASAPASASTPAPASASASTSASASASTPAPASASASTPVSSVASAVSDNAPIGPQENPDKAKPTTGKSAKKRAAAAEDLETKKKKMLEGGTSAESVRMCEICKVVCNSETVFRYHLAGQKHAAMVKKHGSSTSIAATT